MPDFFIFHSCLASKQRSAQKRTSAHLLVHIFLAESQCPYLISKSGGAGEAGTSEHQFGLAVVALGTGETAPEESEVGAGMRAQGRIYPFAPPGSGKGPWVLSVHCGKVSGLSRRPNFFIFHRSRAARHWSRHSS